jgi:hypothetical protein
MLIVLKSGSLNFLENSGPLQGCCGVALHFTMEKVVDKSLDEVNRSGTKLIRPNEEENTFYLLQNS